MKRERMRPLAALCPTASSQAYAFAHLPFALRALWLRALLLGALLAAPGCARREPESAPDTAVRALLENLADAAREPHAFPDGGRDAYRYLATSTKKKLELRAERASKLQGRRIAAEDMLVTGRFALRFEPRVYASVVRGERAEVEIRGDKNDDVAKVLCVREPHPSKDNVMVWRVELEVPDAPVPQKQDRLP